MTIREFIKANNSSFDRYRSRGSWNGYNVYHVWAKRNEGCVVGLPQFALEKDGKFRLAKTNEIFAIIEKNTQKKYKIL